MKARSGSEASRVIAETVSGQLRLQLRLQLMVVCIPSSLDALACVWGWTVGPGEVSASSRIDGAFVVLV